jgi:hypothetical protein
MKRRPLRAGSTRLSSPCALTVPQSTAAKSTVMPRREHRPGAGNPFVADEPHRPASDILVDRLEWIGCRDPCRQDKHDGVPTFPSATSSFRNGFLVRNGTCGRRRRSFSIALSIKPMLSRACQRSPRHPLPAPAHRRETRAPVAAGTSMQVRPPTLPRLRPSGVAAAVCRPCCRACPTATRRHCTPRIGVFQIGPNFARGIGAASDMDLIRPSLPPPRRRAAAP